MADVKWIKILTDIFDDEKILMIESLPSSDSLIVIWFKLLCMAGKTNNNGVFLMNNKIAYTDEMLAAIFRRDINIVRMALEVFKQYGMIEIVNDVITIPNWNKHQALDTYEKKKERDRIYQQERREKQKILAEESANNRLNVDKKSSDNRLTSNDKSLCVAVSEEDIEEDIEKEKEINNLILSNDNICQTESPTMKKTNRDLVLEKWNELSSYGILSIKNISTETQRGKYLSARIKQYGIEAVLEAIENIKRSDFLQGKHSGKPFVITFDWFIKPNNFIKVLEGNYTNKDLEQNKPTKSQVQKPETKVDDDESINLWDMPEEEYLKYVAEHR